MVRLEELARGHGDDVGVEPGLVGEAKRVDGRLERSPAAAKPIVPGRVDRIEADGQRE